MKLNRMANPIKQIPRADGRSRPPEALAGLWRGSASGGNRDLCFTKALPHKIFGATSRIRTGDLCFTKALLYQLS